jgi:multiple sugar transport system ATP-binding protein
VVVLNHGVIQQIGGPHEIYDKPANLFVADFMGSPPMNLLPGGLDYATGNALVTFTGGQSLTIPNAAPALAAYHGKDVTFGIRPEALRMGNTLSGPVHLVENSGSDTFVTLKIGDRNVIARFPGRVPVDSHKDIGIDLDLSQVSWFDTKTGQRIV